MSRPRLLLAACAILHASVPTVLLLGPRRVVPATIITLTLIAVLYSLAAYVSTRARWGRLLGLAMSGAESVGLALLTFRIWQVYFTGPGVQTFGWPEVLITVALPVHIASFVSLRRTVVK